MYAKVQKEGRREDLLPATSSTAINDDAQVSLYSRMLSLIPREITAEEGGTVRLLLLSKAVRMFSFGFLAVMLVTYLSTLGCSETEIGGLFTLTLLGDAVMSLVITSHADKIGRRTMLLAGGTLSIATSLIFSLTSSYPVLVLAATLGVISPSGNEVGPFMAIELSALAQITSDSARTNLMAWYNLTSCFSSAAGAVMCGLLLSMMGAGVGAAGAILGSANADTGDSAADAATASASSAATESARPYQIIMLLYCLLQAVKTLTFYRLDASIEAPSAASQVVKASPYTLFLGLNKSKAIVLKLSALFTLDSFAGAFILQSVISHWFHTKFHTPAATLGFMVFTCNIVAGLSALAAVSVANRIGLVMTMVVTHLPSNVLTILVPLMPTQASAIAMLCLRYSISQMDVPTRNAYVQGVVEPDERSAANGLTNVARSVGASLAPLFAGLIFRSDGPTSPWPFLIAGSLKIVYDLLLLYNMRSVPTAGERQQQQQQQQNQGQVHLGKELGASQHGLLSGDGDRDVDGYSERDSEVGRAGGARADGAVDIEGSGSGSDEDEEGWEGAGVEVVEFSRLDRSGNSSERGRVSVSVTNSPVASPFGSPTVSPLHHWQSAHENDNDGALRGSHAHASQGHGQGQSERGQERGFADLEMDGDGEEDTVAL